MEIKKGGKFINFGCYDCVSNDPILNYILEYNLTGYFVDANFEVLSECRDNFIGFDYTFVGLGIHTSSGSKTFYEPKKIKNVPEWFYQTGTFSYEKVKEICGKLKIPLDSYVEKVVDCETITDFITKRELFDLEVVNIDLEGLDSEVIRQFPFNLVKPKVIIIEINSEKGIDTSTFDFICSQGYTSDKKPITDWSICFLLQN